MQAAARIVCICVLFILGSCSGDRVALTLLQPGDTVLAFGDSLTAEVLLLGVPQPGAFLSTADFYDEIAEETGVAYLPDLMQEVLSDASLKSDAAHPNAAGYQFIASDIHAYLLEAGAL